MIRTNIVTLTVIKGAAYRQRLPAGSANTACMTMSAEMRTLRDLFHSYIQ